MSADFPRLGPHNSRTTSEASAAYNCVAWAAGDSERLWQPGGHWRPGDASAADFSFEALQRLFQSLGYVDCGLDNDLEPGFEKVAL